MYYRLNVVPIKLPSLKDRFEDIPDLTTSFLNSNYKNKFINRFISYEGMNLLKEYSWPGNIRVKNVIERLFIIFYERYNPQLDKEVLSEDNLMKIINMKKT